MDWLGLSGLVVAVLTLAIMYIALTTERRNSLARAERAEGEHQANVKSLRADLDAAYGRLRDIEGRVQRAEVETAGRTARIETMMEGIAQSLDRLEKKIDALEDRDK